MGTQSRERKESLADLNGVDFDSKLHERHTALGQRKEEFIEWVTTELSLKLEHMREGEAKNNALQFLVQVELTHSFEDWAGKWIDVFSDKPRAPAANIEALIEKYAPHAGDEEWADEPLPQAEATPTIHDIIQRGFKAQTCGDGEAQILEELQDFIARGGDLEQRDNSRMTPLQRCKMLGWANGRQILEEATSATAA